MDNDPDAWDYPDIPPPPPRLPLDRNHRNSFQSPRNQPERDAWAAARWTINRWTYQEIANALGLSSKSTAHDAVQRGLRVSREIAQATAEQARSAHRARLEFAHEAAMAVLEAEHITVSNGRIVVLDGHPVTDYDPILRTLDRIVKISESLRRLDGLDQPIKVDATVAETSQQDIELQEMVNEFRAKNSTTEGQLRATRERPE